MTPVRSAVIAGGGIAGLATALALRQAGVLRGAAGRRLGATPTGLEPPDGPVSRTLRRSDLSAALTERAAAAGIPVIHDRRLVDVADGPDGVTAVFADGARAAADVLIGADGVFSTVRRLIDPDAPAPRYTGLLNVGGTTRAAGTGTAAGTFERVFGRRAFLGHVAAPDGAAWWFANVPRRDEPARDEARDPATLRAELLELFRGDAGPAARLISDAEELWALGPTHAMPHLPRWHAGRMVVVGDAVHAPTPSSGQGASLALEDAVVLAGCLRDAPSHRAAFEHFEALRRQRVERIVKQALRTNAGKAPGPLGRAVRDALMPLVLPLMARSKAQREVVAYRAADAVAPPPRAAAAR